MKAILQHTNGTSNDLGDSHPPLDPRNLDHNILYEILMNTVFSVLCLLLSVAKSDASYKNVRKHLKILRACLSIKAIMTMLLVGKIFKADLDSSQVWIVGITCTVQAAVALCT